MKTRIKYWSSVAEYAEAARDLPRKWSISGSRETGQSRTRFSLTKDFEEALELALNGTWKCDLPKLEHALRDDLGSNAQRMEFVPDVVGVRPNVPAYCAGEPTSMFSLDWPESERRIVRVLINRSVSAGVKTDEMMQLGATVLACVAQLEQDENCSVELAVCMPNQLAHDFLLCNVVTIKTAGQPLDLSEIAYGIAHPAFFRRLEFSHIEMTPKKYETYSYGRCVDAPSEVADEYDIYIPRQLLGQLKRVRESFAQFFTGMQDAA